MLLGASTADEPKQASETPEHTPVQSVSHSQPPGIPSQMGASSQMPYSYSPLVPNTHGPMAPPHPMYFTILGQNDPLPPPVHMSQHLPTYASAPSFTGGPPHTLHSPLLPGALGTYAYPAMNSGSGGPSPIHGGPPHFPLMQTATPNSEWLGQHATGPGRPGRPGRAREEDLSPKAIRKLSHNAVEARSASIIRPRVAWLLHHPQPSAWPCDTGTAAEAHFDAARPAQDRAQQVPPTTAPPCISYVYYPLPRPRCVRTPTVPRLVRCLSPKADKAALLSEAVDKITLLTNMCHSLEAELAACRGTAPPLAPVPTPNQFQLQPSTLPGRSCRRAHLAHPNQTLLLSLPYSYINRSRW